MIGLSCGAVTLLWSVAVVLRVGPVFRGMYEDLGGEVPFFTRLCLSPAFALVTGAVPLAIVMLGLVRSAGPRARLAAMVAALLAMFGLPAAFLAGMYLPIFSLAAAIR